MTSDNEQQAWIEEEAKPNVSYLHKFRLYETRSNFYVIGRDKNRTIWRVLKIDRLEPSDLNILEDSTTYSEIECSDLLRRIHEGNKSTGGLKFVTACYGIVGFIKFLGPYYMLLITKRRKIGTICGHAVYAISKSEMIPIPNPTVRSTMGFSKNENRSFVNSACKCKMSLVELSISGRYFKLTLIARRSRHFAGTRYLKRGVNEKGRVANDVETEQIAFEDVPEGCPICISSVVQNRGSIPLFWSQETSRMNIKPDIILSKKDHKYQATRLHFENLVKRYGNPVIILNLIKTREKKPRESILRAEFGNAIALINKDLTGENRLKFLHLDLNKYSKNKAIDVLALLWKVAAYALNFTGFFYCQVAPTSGTKGLINWSYFQNNYNGDFSVQNLCDTKMGVNGETDDTCSSIDKCGKRFVKPPMFQKGVLRTNCIDCLDRTNVAQFAFGLVSLGHQLHALGFTDDPIIGMDCPLADDLMGLYETMGDTLALQYGGSAAHNKIFSQRRGHWKAAVQSQEFLRTLQRYYSNAYMDAEKQDAINVFLGHFQPQQGKPALWELDSDQHYSIGRLSFKDENGRSFLKRSLSDGNIPCESNSPLEVTDAGQMEEHNQSFPDNMHDGNKDLSESTPEISTCESELSYTRYTPSMSSRRLFPDMQPDQCLESDCNCFDGRRNSFNCSNFLDVDWLSSSGNSCEEDAYERSTLISSPIAGVSSDSVLTGLKMESGVSPSESGKSSDVTAEFSDNFVRWVSYGEMLFP
ncbi:hypothetical protein RHGRI_035420 [Rhododendron griersonianum]|uniref:SAC domain-containing protein n=1 Tax=Rhododendron griersonianum TaxID=479676 RepID=A0AAV6I529_9ERIC|nr:hypothetical protein RHGRI_035420 [Rhododendron griersonianum]